MERGGRIRDPSLLRSIHPSNLPLQPTFPQLLLCPAGCTADSCSTAARSYIPFQLEPQALAQHNSVGSSVPAAYIPPPHKCCRNIIDQSLTGELTHWKSRKNVSLGERWEGHRRCGLRCWSSLQCACSLACAARPWARRRRRRREGRRRRRRTSCASASAARARRCAPPRRRRPRRAAAEAEADTRHRRRRRCLRRRGRSSRSRRRRGGIPTATTTSSPPGAAGAAAAAPRPPLATRCSSSSSSPPFSLVWRSAPTWCPLATTTD